MVSLGALARKVFGSSNDRRIKGLRPRVETINALEAEMTALSDGALKAKTAEFRSQIAEGRSLDDLLVPAFAVAREAARRALGLRHQVDRAPHHAGHRGHWLFDPLAIAQEDRPDEIAGRQGVFAHQITQRGGFAGAAEAGVGKGGEGHGVLRNSLPYLPSLLRQVQPEAHPQAAAAAASGQCPELAVRRPEMPQGNTR